VIHRRDELRAEKILQDRMFRNPKIEMAWSSVVDEILGTDDPPGVAGVRIRNVKTSAARVVDVKGVFIAIGHTPNTELFQGQLHMDAEGYIVTAPDSTATSISGVYAAGDVQDRIYRQAVTAAGTGCMAALEAEKFLAEQETVTVAAQ
jgi:thioredoxin reductase (NADPH)